MTGEPEFVQSVLHSADLEPDVQVFHNLLEVGQDIGLIVPRNRVEVIEDDQDASVPRRLHGVS